MTEPTVVVDLAPAWTAELPAASGLRGLVADERRVYAVGGRTVEAYDVASGQPLSRATLPGSGLYLGPRPRVAAGRLLVLADHALIALDAATGAPLWSDATIRAASGRVLDVALDAGAAYALEQTGKTRAFDAATGAPRWTRTLLDSARIGELPPARAWGTLTLTDAGVVVAAVLGFQGTRSAAIADLADPATGVRLARFVWDAASPGAFPANVPRVVRGSVLAMSGDAGAVVAYRLAAGPPAVRWTLDLAPGGEMPVLDLTTRADGVALVVNGERPGRVEVYDAGTGRLRWRVAAPAVAGAPHPAGVRAWETCDGRVAVYRWGLTNGAEVGGADVRFELVDEAAGTPHARLLLPFVTPQGLGPWYLDGGLSAAAGRTLILASRGRLAAYRCR